jgi:excisionase family DNA binding protein
VTVATVSHVLPEPEFLQVKEAMTVLRMGRTTLYQEINSGRLISVTRGRRRLIPMEAVRKYAALLKKEGANTR